MAKKQKFDHYVFSTLSSDMDYTVYRAGGGDVPVPDGHVRIAGGANIADGRFDTPLGVSTGVTSEQLEMLMDNAVFQLHQKNGFIQVRDTDDEPEVVAADDMEGRDGSAPLVPQDFDQGKEPLLNTAKPSRKA